MDVRRLEEIRGKKDQKEFEEKKIRREWKVKLGGNRGGYKRDRVKEKKKRGGKQKEIQKID